MKTENGVGCHVDNSLFWQAWGMENIWVDVSESAQILCERLGSKTFGVLGGLKSQMIL